MRFIPRTPEYLEQRAERRRIARRKWVQKNQDAMQFSRDNWKRNNRDRILQKRRERTKRITGKTVTPFRRSTVEEKRGKHRLRSTESYHRRKLHPHILIKNRLRSRVLVALGKKKAVKSKRTIELIGCSWDFLKNHIESQFKEGMSWENRSKWHIDHIRPCASFDLTDPSQQEVCFYWLNLRPVWSHENLSKGAKWRQIA